MTRSLPVRPKKTMCLIVFLLIAAAPLLCAQGDFKTVTEKGFTFQYPVKWNFIDLGEEDYEGIIGQIIALNPPTAKNFAVLIVLFPEFRLDLKAKNMTYKNFLKLFLEAALRENSEEQMKITESEAFLQHGKVPAFTAMGDEQAEAFKATMICGDLVDGRAAVLLVAMNLTAENKEEGEEYIKQANAVISSFAFPKKK